MADRELEKLVTRTVQIEQEARLGAIDDC